MTTGNQRQSSLFHCITSKLAIAMGGIMLLLVSMVGWISHSTMTHHIEKHHSKEVYTNAVVIAQLTTDLINSWENDLHRIIEDPAVKKYQESSNPILIERFFSSFMDKFPVISYINTRGMMEITVDKAHPRETLVDVSTTSLYLNASQNANTIQLGSVEHLPSQRAIVQLAYQGSDYFDNVLGTINAAVPVSRFSNLIANTQLHEGWYVLIIHASGHIIYSSQEIASGSKLNEDTDTDPELIRQLLLQKKIHGRYRLLATDCVVASAGGASGGQWQVLIGVPLTIYEELLRDLRQKSLPILALTLILSLVLMVFLGNRITRPIVDLTNTITEISASNDLSRQVACNAKDEIGELARSFNTMLHELAIAHELTNSIFQGSGDGMRVIDDNFTLLRANDAMALLSNTPSAEQQGKKCYDQFCDERCMTETCTLRRILRGAVQVKSEAIRYTVDGQEIPVELFATPLLIDGKVAGIIESFRDITARKNAEQEKEQLQAQFLQAQKLESVGQLAAGIAHEINTPSQYIGTNIDFLDEAAKDINALVEQIQQIADKAPREIRDKILLALEEADWEYLSEEIPLAVNQSRDGIKRVSSIVLAMKEFSHPSSKEKEARDINQIINTIVTVARNEWKYVAEMKLDLDSALPNIPLLADEMGQVILNILVNAAQAIGEKLGDNPSGEKGTITIGTKQLDQRIELRISDTGAGIPEKARPRIFDPFYTTKQVGKGTGQGLAISRDVIVEKHGGNIDFTTETDKGTEFIIQLPLQDGESL